MIYTKKPIGFRSDFEVGGCFILHRKDILLLKRNENKSYPGCYGIPGGKTEKDETPLQGIQREVLEETGMIVSPKLFKTVYVQQNNTSFVYRMYIEKVSQKTEVILAPAEHISYTWIDAKKSLQLPLVEDTERCIEMFMEEMLTLSPGVPSQ